MRLAVVGGDSLQMWDAAMIAGECHPPDPQFYHARARYCKDREMWDATIQNAAKAIQCGGNDMEIWLVQARALAELERWDEAEADYRTILAPHTG